MAEIVKVSSADKVPTKGSFILYSKLVAGDGLVDCIYFALNECRAQPSVTAFVRGTRGGYDYYRPTEEDQKRYCKTEKFNTCPRFQAYQDYLKLAGVKQ